MGYKSVTDKPAVHEQDLSVHAGEIAFDEAARLPSFAQCLELLAFWSAISSETPHYNTIRPDKLPSHILPILFILDVEDGYTSKEPDFKWRLFGTAIRQRYGIEATGHLLSKAIDLDASIPESLRLARKTLATRQPHFMLTHFTKGERLEHCSSTILLPLAGDSGNVERIFGCTDWS